MSYDFGRRPMPDAWTTQDDDTWPQLSRPDDLDDADPGHGSDDDPADDWDV